MKNKMCYRIVSWFLLVALSVMCLPMKYNPVSAETLEEKIYCNATLEDEFSDDTVIVILNQEASVSEKEYSKNDFSESQCVSVTNLTSEATAVARGQKTNQLVNTEKFRRILSIKLEEKSKQNVLDVIDVLIQRDDVIYAGPDYLMEMTSGEENSSEDTSQWAIDALDLPEAWDFAMQGSVKVGVVDSGIDKNNPCFYRGEGVSRISVIDEESGGTFYNSAISALQALVDSRNHGTAVASVIATLEDNSLGIRGVNSNVELVSLKIYDTAYNDYSIDAEEYHSTVMSRIVAAISYATSKGIKILNISSAFYQENVPSGHPDFIQAIENYAGLVIMCAGNDGKNIDNDESSLILPERDALDNLIVVGALQESGDRWQNSNYGENSVDIYAPGDDILVACDLSPGSVQYKRMSGTSFAAPYVTGVASLLWSISSLLTPAEIKATILNSAVTISITVPNDATNAPSDTTTQTVKSLNALNAVRYFFSQHAPTTTVQDSLTIVYEEVTQSWCLTNNRIRKININNDNEYAFSITSDYPCEVRLYDSNLQQLNIAEVSTQNNCQIDFEVPLTTGEYYLRITYLDEWDEGEIGIEILPHTHSYSCWTYYDRASHIESCSCGITGTLTQAHAVKPSDRYKPFANCIGCGVLLDMRFDIGEMPDIQSLTQKFTLNGSYILSNGIIVLVEEDVEAYLHNTLVFFDEDDLPQSA